MVGSKRDRAKWVSSIRDLYEAYENDTPQFRLNKWEAAFRTASYKTQFQPEERFSTEWVVPTTVDGVLDRMLSKSYVSVLGDGEKEVLKERAADVLRRGEGVKWVDVEEGVFEYPYRTFVIHLKKKEV